MLDKKVMQSMSKDITKALASVGEKYNVSISMNGGRFDSNTANLKMKVVSVTDGGVKFDEAADSFRRYAEMYNLKPTDLGKSFISNGRTYKIVGLKPRNRSYPILAEGPNGGRYKFSTSVVNSKVLK